MIIIKTIISTTIIVRMLVITIHQPPPQVEGPQRDHTFVNVCLLVFSFLFFTAEGTLFMNVQSKFCLAYFCSAINHQSHFLIRALSFWNCMIHKQVSERNGCYNKYSLNILFLFPGRVGGPKFPFSNVMRSFMSRVF